MKILGFLGVAFVLAQIKPAMDAIDALSSIEYLYVRNEVSTDEYNVMRAPVIADIKENIIITIIGVLLFICAFI